MLGRQKCTTHNTSTHGSQTSTHMVTYIQLPQAVEYRAHGHVVQLRLYSFINPLRSVGTSGKFHSGAGGATIDKKACITVCNKEGNHEMMNSVSRAAARAHEIIANCKQSINGWRSLTFQGKRLQDVAQLMVNPDGMLGNVLHTPKNWSMC